MKIAIIGNSGSGKTWLATRLAVGRQLPVVHLDDLFWEPGGFNQKRSSEAVSSLIDETSKREQWVVEGVFGELAEQYLGSADLLIWLDVDWAICRSRLEERGSESRKHMDREQSEEGLKKLIDWASRYGERTDMRSFEGHRSLFEGFIREKVRLRNPNEVAIFQKSTQQPT